jgi:hypothetical protein
MSENATTHSVALDDLSLDQLVQISQGFGHQIERLREQRLYLRRKIDARLAAGERTNAPVDAAGDATAPGAVIDAAAKA